MSFVGISWSTPRSQGLCMGPAKRPCRRCKPWTTSVDVVLQGVRNIGKTDLRPTCIFLRSPSLDRLEQRNTDTEQSLAAARADLKPGEQQGARPVWPDHGQRQPGQGLLGPEGGALRRNGEGSRNWSLLRRSASCVPPGAWGLAPLRARVALLTSASALACGCCPAPSLPRRGCWRTLPPPNRPPFSPHPLLLTSLPPSTPFPPQHPSYPRDPHSQLCLLPGVRTYPPLLSSLFSYTLL